MAIKKATKKPAPDLKGATQEALRNAAYHLEDLALEDVFAVLPERRVSKAEWAVMEEARSLAVAYIRKGAEG